MAVLLFRVIYLLYWFANYGVADPRLIYRASHKNIDALRCQSALSHIAVVYGFNEPLNRSDATSTTL